MDKIELSKASMFSAFLEGADIAAKRPDLSVADLRKLFENWFHDSYERDRQ